MTTANQLAGYASSLPSLRNKIINGDMRIDQRNAGSAVTTHATFPVDRFRFLTTAGGSLSFEQVEDGPVGFFNSCKLTVGTGATPSGGVTGLNQQIEGYNVSDLELGTTNAKTFTLSFWVKSTNLPSYPATLGISMMNVNTDRFYLTSYTINSSNTWEYKTVTVNGDTSGTWNKTNDRGLRIDFDLGTQTSNRSSTTNQWHSSGTYLQGPTGTTDVIATTNATWQITGVQLEEGTVATPFEHRPIGVELGLCQRYYEKSYNVDVALGTLTSEGAISYRVGNGDCLYSFRNKVEKRTTAAYTIYNPITGSTGEARNLDTNVNYSVTGVYASASGMTIVMSGIAGAHIQFHYISTAEL